MSDNNPRHFPAQETQFFVEGPAGRLEVVAQSPQEVTRPVTVIMCHPHPLHGGTMSNKVVFTAVRAFHQLGLRTVKFNFRGVGLSQGSFADAIGESEDLVSVINWVKQVKPDDRLWLAGFSFGSYVAARVADRVPVNYLISIAPPVHHYDFTSLKGPQSPWLVIQGDDDEVVPPQQVFDWLDQCQAKPSLIRLKGVGHFFHGRLTDLRQHLVNEGSQQLTTFED